jgi:hypothetical protein
MFCPYNDKTCRCGEFCVVSIWSTPGSAGNHAKQVRRVVDNCRIRGLERDADDTTAN